MTSLLLQLESLLPRDVAATLRPGTVLPDLRNSHGLRSDAAADLRALYGWHDGCEDLVELSVFGFRLLGVSESIEISRRRQRYLPGMAYPFSFYPLGESDSGSIIATLADTCPESTKVYHYFPDEGSADLIYDSIESMIKVAIVVWGGKRSPVPFEKLLREFSPHAGSRIDIN